MELLFASWEHIPFNENHIQQLHRDLLQYSGKDGHHRGQYKKISNNVAAFNEKGEQVTVVFETATPFDTPRLMQELVEWVRHTRENKTLHPLLIVAIFVVVFLEIHPFEDGNGRLSRILTTLRERMLSQRLPKLSADLVVLAREHGRLTTLQAEQQTGANRATIKAHLAKLVKDGHLVKHGIGRGTWYVASGQ